MPAIHGCNGDDDLQRRSKPCASSNLSHPTRLNFVRPETTATRSPNMNRDSKKNHSRQTRAETHPLYAVWQRRPFGREVPGRRVRKGLRGARAFFSMVCWASIGTLSWKFFDLKVVWILHLGKRFQDPICLLLPTSSLVDHGGCC